MARESASPRPTPTPSTVGIDAGLEPPAPIAGLGPMGRRAERCRRVADFHIAETADTPDSARNILGKLIRELCGDIAVLIAELNRRSRLVDSLEMGLDAEGRKTIVIRWHDLPIPDPTED